MEEMKLRTLSVLVDNEAGVLSQISRLFSRKGFNVESLAVGATDHPEISRMTIEVMANENQTNLMCNQLAKMVPVHSVKLLVPSHSIRRELVLYKVRAKNSEDKNEIIQIANIFRGSIIDVSKETLTLSVIGDEKKTDAVQELLEGFGIVELVRTGIIALERGKYTIDEDTKEKGEFNYGKDVLLEGLRPESTQRQEDRDHRLRLPGPCPRSESPGFRL